MLHVKRLKGRLALSFQKKERGFSKEFILALCIALLLHIGCFSLFKITTISADNSVSLSPIHVEVDMSTPTLTNTFIAFPLEQNARPCLPSPHLLTPLQESSYHVGWQEPDFSSIEEIDYESLYIDFDEDDD